MLDETVLRQQARAAIDAGRIPVKRPDRTWGGPGIGAECAICEQPVGRDQLEFEVQFAHDGDSPGLDRFHLHLRCFAMWELERVKVS